MKKNILPLILIGALICMLSIKSCTADYQTDFLVESLVVPDDDLSPIFFPIEGGNKTIRVNTNISKEKWTASSNSEWINVDKQDDMVVISTGVNDLYVNRVARVTIEYGHQSYSISVTQSGSESYIFVRDLIDDKYKEVGAFGGTLSVELISNMSIDYVSIPDTVSWIQLKSINDSEEGPTLEFDISMSPATNFRYCTIEIQSKQNPNIITSFTVRQRFSTTTRIWNEANHSAYTSLIKFQDHYYAAFREGATPEGGGGTVRVIKSIDGTDWESVQTLKLDAGYTEEIYFNGSQNMYIPHHTDFDYTSTDGFTATAYVNLPPVTGNSIFLGNRNGGNGWQIAHDKGQFLTDIANPYLRFYQTSGNHTLTPNVWHHVAYVFDGANKTVDLYVDGVKSILARYPSNINLSPTHESNYGNQIVLFSNAPNHKTNPVGYSGYVKGEITFLRFWNKALSASEIASDMTAEVTETSPNLIAGYDFRVKEVDGANLIIPDIKGKHPGILRNFSLDDMLKPTDVGGPKLSITADNRIMLIVDADIYRRESVDSRRPYVSYSDVNGENFSDFEKSNVYYPANDGLSDSNFSIWNPVNHKGVIYGVDYEGDKLVLFTSDDNGKTFRTVKVLDRDAIGNSPSEVSISFDKNDKMYAFIRRNGPGNTLESSKGYLGTSVPPYTNWSYNELDYRLEGQSVLFLNDSFVIGTRGFDVNNSNPHVAIYVTDLDGNIKKQILLPSSGDCGYPGLALDDNSLSITYHSSHEGKSSIYFTEIPIDDLK